MSRVRSCISTDAVEVIVQTMITSKLDYCNPILYGLPAWSLSYLQTVQNTAARFISQTRKYDHIKPVMKNLHWLLIRSRIEYMILIRSTPQSMDAHSSTSGNYYAEDLTEEQNMNNLLLPKFWSKELSIRRPKTVELSSKWFKEFISTGHFFVNITISFKISFCIYHCFVKRHRVLGMHCISFEHYYYYCYVHSL